MSTRSYIAIENIVSKKILATYVHSDGYPDGVGHTLISFYDTYDKALKLFDYGQASYLGKTIEECCFYHRDMKRELDKTETYENEFFLMNDFKGDIFIEYIYLFRNNEWIVSSLKFEKKPKDIHNYSSLVYRTEFIPVKKHSEYTGKQSKMNEVQMLGKLAKAFKQAGFEDTDVIIQGAERNKLNS